MTVAWAQRMTGGRSTHSITRNSDQRERSKRFGVQAICLREQRTRLCGFAREVVKTHERSNAEEGEEVSGAKEYKGHEWTEHS